MKKLLFVVVMLTFCSMAYAIEFNVDARTDFIYSNYIKNSAYNAISLAQTLTVVDMYEKIRLKANHTIDQVKFNFDGRLYLNPSKTDIDYAIDSAYITVENGPFVLYAGKQRVKWGTGYFWNPTDNLQPAKNVFRTTEDLEGIYAIRGELSTGSITPSVMIMKNTLNNSSEVYRDINAAVQLYYLAGTCDIFMNYIYKTEGESYGAAISWDLDWFVLNAEASARVRAGTNVPDLRGKQYDYAFAAGASKTISDEVSGAIEYYRNSSGMDNNTFASAAAIMGFVPPMGKKDYLAYTVSYIFDQQISLSLTGMNCLNDGTTYIFPSVAYVENQNFDVAFSLFENLTGEGVKEGRNSTPVYNTVELRINAYF